MLKITKNVFKIDKYDIKNFMVYSAIYLLVLSIFAILGFETYFYLVYKKIDFKIYLTFNTFFKHLF